MSLFDRVFRLNFNLNFNLSMYILNDGNGLPLIIFSDILKILTTFGFFCVDCYSAF
jgi:hypothetical protein